MRYVIFVKGWGHKEDQFYPQVGNNNAEDLFNSRLEESKDWPDMPVEFYILDTDTCSTTHNGILIGGVYHDEPVFDA